MASNAPQQGNETRSSILPTSMPSGIGFLGSSYSPADALLAPPDIGVKAGDGMSDVINAVKGVAFYADMIGFGQSSTPMTAGMPLKPLGVNYFANTGQTCSNGANMYQYVQGIPQGTALGSRVANVMSEMGLPALKGLAPGMMEDAESALDPSPLLNAVLGSGYPQCKQVTLQVGDAYGHIADPDTGAPWIDQPETATQGSDGLFYQTRWVQDVDGAGNPISLTKDQWSAVPKTYNPDGTPMSGTTEGFLGARSFTASMAIVGILALVGYAVMAKRR
jgi:hypothetical protein